MLIEQFSLFALAINYITRALLRESRKIKEPPVCVHTDSSSKIEIYIKKIRNWQYTYVYVENRRKIQYNTISVSQLCCTGVVLYLPCLCLALSPQRQEVHPLLFNSEISIAKFIKFILNCQFLYNFNVSSINIIRKKDYFFIITCYLPGACVPVRLSAPLSPHAA